MSDLDDKVAIITGAASGIGKSCAQTFARRGARVVVSDLADSDGESVAAGLRDDGYEAIFVACDVSKPDDVKHLVAETVEQFGGLDIGVNNAGISGDMKPTGDYGLSDWQQIIDVNLTGAFLCMRAQICEMLKGTGGSIVNIASIAGAVGFATAPAYTAAKHGLVGLTKAAALEYGQSDIRVTAVGPAVINTPMVDFIKEDDETHEAMIGAHPIGRFGEPEEVANVVAFLASDEASFVTGSYHAVDGGYLSQ